MNESLAEKRTGGALVFEGDLLKVYRDEVSLASGHLATREYIKHPGTVLIVALLDNNKVLFVRQFRYASGQVSLELPAGRIDPGEEPLAAAKRELREETGHVAASWTPLASFHPCIGYSDETVRVFVARKLDYLGTENDHAEPLEPTSLPLDGAITAVTDGVIVDAKSMTALLLTDRALRARSI